MRPLERLVRNAAPPHPHTHTHTVLPCASILCFNSNAERHRCVTLLSTPGTLGGNSHPQRQIVPVNCLQWIPDVAKTVAVVTPRRISLDPVGLNLDKDRRGLRKKSDRTIAQAVSRRFPAATARVRSQLMWDSWWTYLLRIRGLSCQFSYCRLLHINLLSGAGVIVPLVAGVPNGVNFIPLHQLKISKKWKKQLWRNCQEKQ
jgi:hypothetical protein